MKSRTSVLAFPPKSHAPSKADADAAAEKEFNYRVLFPLMSKLVQLHRARPGSLIAVDFLISEMLCCAVKADEKGGA
jgi:hypothetical protein